MSALFLTTAAKAQQVTKINCCGDLSTKATIIINNSTTATAASATPVNTTTVNGGFNFKLDVAASTSAGIYNSSGVLIRTLWSGVRYDAGCYLGQWDGFMDDGTTVAPVGTYTVKTLTNNIQYPWYGAIGNSSFGQPYANLWRSSFFFQGVASAGGYIYGAMGYVEGGISQKKASLTNLQKQINIDLGSTGQSTQSSSAVCTDGINMYWGGQNVTVNGSQNNQSFVFATKVSDDSEVLFTSGQQVINNLGGRIYQKGISVITTAFDANAAGYGMDAIAISGIAVNSNYLFVARKLSNTITVLNKTTGTPVSTFTTTAPVSLACSTDNNSLWIGNATAVTKYTIGANGSLTSAGVSIQTVGTTAMAISPITGFLAIADNGTQQVKFYNGAGTLQGTFGQLGGYNNSPAVTYDKFQLNTPAITFQSDGSFWLNDDGNFRLLHTSSSFNYVEQIDFFPATRGVTADYNDPTCVIVGNMEFKVDYTKALDGGQNGSWKLKNNWVRSLDWQVFTLSNGVRYASDRTSLYALLPAGATFVCNLPNSDFILNSDGSLQEKQVNADDVNGYYTCSVYNYPLTGFNGLVPLWGSRQFIARTPAASDLYPSNTNNNTYGTVSNNNRYIAFFQAYHDGFNGLAYHLASVKRGGTSYEWATSKQNFTDYYGDYPKDGTFDVGGFAGHSENCKVHVQGSDVFWHVNTELAQRGQSNIFNHYNEDGLFLGHFGVTDVYASGSGDYSGAAGNSFATSLVKVGSDYYIWYCDESYWGGVGCYKVTNLSSIKEQSVSLTVSAAINYVPDPTDLMYGLPFQSSSFTGNSKWTASLQSGATVKSSKYSSSRPSPDLYISANGNSQFNYLSRDLGTNNTNNWSITGSALFQYGSYNDNGSEEIKLLDATGKVLVRFRFARDPSDVTTVRFNDQVLFTGKYTTAPSSVFYDPQPFSIINTNGVITVSYWNYTTILTTPSDTGGDFTKPAKFQIQVNANDGRIVDVGNLKFIK